MPAGKRQQSSAMLYTLITFVGLFIAATIIAVIYYVKAEEHRTNAADLQIQIDELATSRQRREMGTIVGAKQARKSRLSTMVDYLDQAVSLIVGGVAEPTSAEVKVKNANREVRKALNLAQEHIDIGSADPNTTGLTRVIKELKAKLDNTINEGAALKEQFEELQQRFDDAMTAGFAKEQVLLSEKEKLQQQVNKIQQDYNELQAFMKQSTEQQVQTLSAQLFEERANLKTLNQELLKTQAELKDAEDMMRRAQQEVMKIKRPPDREVLAYRPDGKIILVDNQAKTVHLNIGSDNHVYRGLTFSVYDRGASIPKDGRGKAEIEVFDLAKTFSSARVTRSEINKPILQGDIIANLIWDSDEANIFVVAGEFDLNNDGDIDYEAVEKIKTLIEKWGGRVADTVSIDTDFVVLGNPPMVPKKPTFEDLELDPTAMQRYEAAQKKLDHYKETQSRAQALWLPIFKYERFLYFIGYKGQISRPGAF